MGVGHGLRVVGVGDVALFNVFPGKYSLESIPWKVFSGKYSPPIAKGGDCGITRHPERIPRKELVTSPRELVTSHK